MDSIKETLTEMMELFHKRMTDFDAELQKSSTTSSSTTSLAADFASFRTFITNVLNNLQQQVQILARNVDNLEMRGRRKMLLVHGLKEANKEDTSLLLVNLLKDRLQLSDILPSDIKRCHRLGRATDSHKPRPILCKFHETAVRDKVWYAKTKLKGSGVTISEFLTKSRHDLFIAAREKFGVTKCFTQEGSVLIIRPDGVRLRVDTLLDLNTIDPEDKVKNVAMPPRATKAKRVISSKK